MNAHFERKRTPSRREFMCGLGAVATASCLNPHLLIGGPQMTETIGANLDQGEVLDEALEMMAGLAPLTNHGPMAAEALVTLGRGDQVINFVEGYKRRFVSKFPPADEPINQRNWRQALGIGKRVADWVNFFDEEMKEAAWPQVLARWSAVLTPGLSAAAAHGLIRTGHAVRSLSVKETALRRHELAQGLGYWAAYYRELPHSSREPSQNLEPSIALARVPMLPNDQRGASGSIMVGLAGLSQFEPFAGVITLVEPTANFSGFLSQVSEAFANAYLKNVTPRNFITLIHTVTATTALRSLLPHLSAANKTQLLRYGWQVSSALYSIAGIGSTNPPLKPREITRDELIRRAVNLQEEHAIKFSEACLREYALNPRPVYLQAADDALQRLAPVTN